MKKESARVLTASLILCVAAACSKAKAPDVLDQKDNGSTPIARTTNCTVPNDDGQRCNVKTCKADAASDCAQFKEGCTKYDHTYTGDNSSGTCTRGPMTGSTTRKLERVSEQAMSTREQKPPKVAG